MASEKIKRRPMVNVRMTADDQRVVVELEKKLGVNRNSLTRMGWRLLAQKEGLRA